AEQLRELVMEKRAVNSPGMQEAIKEKALPAYRLSFSDLIKLSLTANHLEAFFILAALLINILDEVKQIFGDSDYLDTYGRSLVGQTMFVLTFLLVIVIVVSMLFSIARTMIKYYGFELNDA